MKKICALAFGLMLAACSKSPADARSHFARWLALRAAHDKPLKHMQYGSTKTKKDYART